MTVFDAEHVSRTSLLFMRQAGDAAAGADRHRSFSLHIVAGADVCSSYDGQAAVITAVKTAVRALGADDDTRKTRVTVSLADPQQKVLGGPSAHQTLAEATRAEGAQVGAGSLRPPDRPMNEPAVPSAPTASSQIVIGEPPADLEADGPTLFVSWSAWSAEVSSSCLWSRVPKATDGNVLSAIAAAALGVATAFFRFADPGAPGPEHAEVRIDLWSPDPDTDSGRPAPPELRYAPARWWLLGLGHLGQAYAHVISWLPYATPAEVEVTLQDVQRTVPANHSTGLLTPAGSNHVHKTRLVASALEASGLDTTIIERRMRADTPVPTSDRHVALIGVDNLPSRRCIDSYGWRTAIDVGLGVGVDDFDGITLNRFPGRPSADIPAWQDPAPTAPPPEAPLAQAPELDACGMARLDGTAVGASFVGALAAVLAICEAVRPLHGGSPRSIQCVSTRDAEVNEALSPHAVELPVALELHA